MTKKFGKFILILFVVSGLIFFSSCRGREFIPDVSVTEPDAAENARVLAEKRARALEEARTKRAEEERQRRASEITTQRSREEAARQAQVRLERDETEHRNRFVQNDVYFEYNESTLKWESQEELKFKSEWLRAHPDETVIIEGHCDERGSEEYNLALGEKRAEAAKSFLIDLGIPGMMIRTVSYGEERPVDAEHNDEAWSKNRRAHFILE